MVRGVKLDLKDTNHAQALALALHVSEAAFGPYEEYWEANHYLQPGVALRAAKAVALENSVENREGARLAGEAVFDKQPSFGLTAAFEAAEAVGFCALAAAHEKAYKKWTQNAVNAALNCFLVGADLEETVDFHKAWEKAKEGWWGELDEWRKREIDEGPSL